MQIRRKLLVPSSAYVIDRKMLKEYEPLSPSYKPSVGDVVLCQVVSLGQHKKLENKSGRLHDIYPDYIGIFVFGNRYAPDYYEAEIPKKIKDDTIDMVARSGLISEVRTNHDKIVSPTKLKILGTMMHNGEIMNTKNFSKVTPNTSQKPKKNRAKLILVVGTSMNSGKSATAIACCNALSSYGKQVKASKLTGTASLKDILGMNDAGASTISDFTFNGYPSTYLIEEDELFDIFQKTDLKWANNPNNYWVVELADGINQRETAMLLKSKMVQDRMHRLVFCAPDSFSAMGGLNYLDKMYGLKPDIISGICTSSPLMMRELMDNFDCKILKNMGTSDLFKLKEALL